MLGHYALGAYRCCRHDWIRLSGQGVVPEGSIAMLKQGRPEE